MEFSGKHTGVSCNFLLQGIFLSQGSNVGLLHCKLWATKEAHTCIALLELLTRTSNIHKYVNQTAVFMYNIICFILQTPFFPKLFRSAVPTPPHFSEFFHLFVIQLDSLKIFICFLLEEWLLYRILLFSVKQQRGALFQYKGVGWGGRWEGSSKGRGCMNTYGWFMLKFDRKQQNSVKLDSFSHSTFYSGILSISEMFSFFNYIKVSLCDYWF